MIAAMAKRYQALLAFVTAPEDVRPLALVRILLCTTLLMHLLHFVSEGGPAFLWFPPEDGGITTMKVPVALGATGVMAVVGLTALSALSGALGFLTRPSLLLCFIGTRLLHDFHTAGRGGYDRLMTNVFFILLLSGCGAVWSIDTYLRQRRQPSTQQTSQQQPQPPPQHMRVFRLLLMFQIGFLYLGAGLYKLSTTWVPFGEASALWFILQNDLWSRLSAPLPVWLYPFTQLATTGAWLFEVTAPVYVLAMVLDETQAKGRVAHLFRRLHVRTLYLLFGISLMVGIEALMLVGPFAFVTLSVYPALLPLPFFLRLVNRVRGGIPNPPESTTAPPA